MSASSKPPLSGLLVLDLGQIYQGPYCGHLLSMAGATVIKVEPPHGDAVRSRRQSPVPLAMLNSRKQAITLNLKNEGGRQIFLKLVDRADVVLENFMPGVMDRLGVGPEALLERNPRLVYGAASGYGSSGPNRDFLAMDLTIQAVSGAMAVTGFPDREPVKAGPAICDFLGGIHLYGAIMTALYERSVTGKGRVVEVAMQDAVFPTLASSLSLFYENPKANPRTGNRHGALAMAPYNTYRTADGYIAIICVTEAHWAGLAQAMGRVDLLANPRFATHSERCVIMDEVDSLVEAWSVERLREEIVAASQEFHFPCAPVRDLNEVVHDRHMHERGMLHYVMHPDIGEVVLPGSPLLFHGTEPIIPGINPRLGEHNKSVFCDSLGFSEEEFERLRDSGAF